MAMEVRRREKKMKKGGDPVNNGAVMFRSEIMDSSEFVIVVVDLFPTSCYLCYRKSEMGAGWLSAVCLAPRLACPTQGC